MIAKTDKIKDFEEWKLVPIEELGEIYGGGTPSRSELDYWNGTIPWVTPSELTNLGSKYLSKTRESITEKGLNKSAAKLLPESSILMTSRATIGEIAINTISVCTNQGFKSIVPNDKANSEFYYYLLQTKKREMINLASGSTFLEISRKDFASILVPRPEIEEQQRIAKILDAADVAIVANKEILDKLQKIKSGLLDDLLMRGLDVSFNLRNPERQPELFKVSSLGLIPKDWDVIELSKIVPYADYGISSSISDKGKIPVLRMNNLKDGEIDINDLKFTSDNISDYLLLKPRDVLFNRTNSMEHVGKTSIWQGQIEKATFASYLVRLVPDRTRITPEFLAAWLNLRATQNLIRRSATPAVQQVNVNPTSLRKNYLALPNTIAEQEKIVEVLDAHDELIRAEESEIEKLKQLKKGLMHDLLTGVKRT